MQTGRFKSIVETALWLVLATVLFAITVRMQTAIRLLSLIASNFAIVIAFHVAIRNLTFAMLGFGSRMRAICVIFARLLVLLLIVSVAVYLIGDRTLVSQFGIAFLGIVFSSKSLIGVIWSSALAAVTLLMILNAEQSRPATLRHAVTDFVRYAKWVVPAIAIVAIFLIVTRYLESAFLSSIRGPDTMADKTLPATVIGSLVYLIVFAVVRLWVVVAILTYSLRYCYQRSAQNLPTSTSPPIT